MSALISGIIGAVAAVAIGLIAERSQQSANTDGNGWKRLRPGWMLHAIFIGCAFFVVLTTYILVTGGSTRPDAEQQNFYLVILGSGFALAGAYIGWTTYGRSVTWNGNELRVRQWLGSNSTRALSDVSSVGKSEKLGEYQLKFRDGFKLKISAYMHGSQDLVSEIYECGDHA